MTGNAQKTHYAREINRFTEGKILDALQLTGKSLPCHVTAVEGSMVTVKFDITGPFTLPEVTVPMFGPEYIRYPMQIGDLGVVLSADVYIGGVTGQGGGVADLTPRGNLTSLIFLPVANTGADTTKNWPAVDSPDALVLYGPDGVVARTADGNTTVTISGDGITIDTDKTVTVTAAEAVAIESEDEITLTANGETITIDSNGVNVSGDLSVDGDVSAGNGASGVFVSNPGKTITISNGIITGFT